MNKRARTVLFVLGIVLIVLLLTPFIYGFSVLKWTNRQVLAELNNPYINSNYDGWKKVSLESSTSFLIPEKWYIKLDDDILTIMDGDSIIANGAGIEKTTSTDPDDYQKVVDNRLAKEARFYPFVVTKRSTKNLTIANLGTGAQYLSVTCWGAQGEEETHYYLSLTYDKLYDYFLDFGVMDGISDPKFAYLPAIAYSYNYTS